MPLLHRLNFSETVSAIIQKRWHNGVTHAHALIVLLLMILDFGGPRPISRLNEWAQQFGIDLLLDIDPAQLHDDKIGHTLDALLPMTDEGECDLGPLRDLHRGNYSRPDYVREMAENALSKYADAGDFVQVAVSDEPALSWMVDWAGFREYRQSLGRYVLFTNLPEDEYSAEYVLEQYRGRHVVEASYRQLKSDLEIAPLHMHKDNRLLAMAAIWVIALMLLSLLQLLVRREGLETRRGQALTGRELLQNLLAVTAVTCTIAGQARASVGPLSEPAQRYLTAMGFPDAQHWLKVPPLDMPLISGISLPACGRSTCDNNGRPDGGPAQVQSTSTTLASARVHDKRRAHEAFEGAHGALASAPRNDMAASGVGTPDLLTANATARPTAQDNDGRK